MIGAKAWPEEVARAIPGQATLDLHINNRRGQCYRLGAIPRDNELCDEDALSKMMIWPRRLPPTINPCPEMLEGCRRPRRRDGRTGRRISASSRGPV